MFLKDKNILILSDYDSRIKWSISLFKTICDGVEFLPSVNVLYRSCPSNIFEYYQVDGNLVQYENLESPSVRLKIENSDLIIIGLGGADNLYVINFIHSLENRPIIIAGFNGLVDHNDPDPLLCRIGADLICVNTEVDMLNYKSMLKKLNVSISTLILTGYQRYYLADKTEIDLSRSRDIWLFIEQIGVPDTDRRVNYLIRKLISIAKKNPDIDLLIHCRHVQGYKTVRKERETSFRKIWKKYKKEIAGLDNIKLVDGMVEDWLLKASFCFSFNSTALIEALYLNKNIGVISDYGISHKLGNHVFIGSNIFMTLEELSKKEIPLICPLWKEKNCTFNEGEELKEKVQELFLLKRSNYIRPYYTIETAPFFFEKKGWRKNTFRTLWGKLIK